MIEKHGVCQIGDALRCFSSQDVGATGAADERKNRLKLKIIRWSCENRSAQEKIPNRLFPYEKSASSVTEEAPEILSPIRLRFGFEQIADLGE